MDSMHGKTLGKDTDSGTTGTEYEENYESYDFVRFGSKGNKKGHDNTADA